MSEFSNQNVINSNQGVTLAENLLKEYEWFKQTWISDTCLSYELAFFNTSISTHLFDSSISSINKILQPGTSKIFSSAQVDAILRAQPNTIYAC